jgi:hypothetical protein
MKWYTDESTEKVTQRRRDTRDENLCSSVSLRFFSRVICENPIDQSLVVVLMDSLKTAKGDW